MIRSFLILFLSVSSLAETKVETEVNLKSKATPLTRSVAADGLDIYSEYFSSVIDTESQKKIDLSNIKTPYSFWVFFQENCQSCKMQFEELKCIPKTKVTSHAVGVLSEPKILLKEARNHSYKGPVYYSKDLIERRLDLEVTPTVFLFKGLTLISRVDNFISCADLKSKIL